jgi:hypothetical protein
MTGIWFPADSLEFGSWSISVVWHIAIDIVYPAGVSSELLRDKVFLSR